MRFQAKDMAEDSHQGVEGGAEDTDELLYNGLRFYIQYTSHFLGCISALAALTANPMSLPSQTSMTAAVCSD